MCLVSPVVSCLCLCMLLHVFVFQLDHIQDQMDSHVIELRRHLHSHTSHRPIDSKSDQRRRRIIFLICVLVAQARSRGTLSCLCKNLHATLRYTLHLTTYQAPELPTTEHPARKRPCLAQCSDRQYQCHTRVESNMRM